MMDYEATNSRPIRLPAATDARTGVRQIVERQVAIESLLADIERQVLLQIALELETGRYGLHDLKDVLTGGELAHVLKMRCALRARAQVAGGPAIRRPAGPVETGTEGVEAATGYIDHDLPRLRAAIRKAMPRIAGTVIGAIVVAGICWLIVMIVWMAMR